MNRQRGFIWGLLPYLLGALAIGGTIFAAHSQWSSFKEGLREDGRDEIRAEWKIEREALIAARDAMILRWSAAIQTVERVYVDRVEIRTVRIAGVREAAGRIRAVTDAVAVPVDDSARRVLGDAERFANAEDPAAAVEHREPAEAVPETADSTLTDWVAFAVDAADSYRDARDKHQACVAFVGEISAAQESPAGG